MLDFKPIISINGRIGSSLDSLDRGLAYGDGLFETLLLHQNTLPYWADHIERLQTDSARLKIHVDQNLLVEYVLHLMEMAKANQISDGLIKIIVTRGAAGRGYQPTLTVAPTIVVMLLPMPLIPESFYEQGVDVFICKHRLPHNELLAGIKHLNKLDYVLAALEWNQESYQEALLFDIENNLIEAISRNIFVVKDGEVFTPSLKKTGVEGIAKKNIVRLIKNELNVKLIEMNIHLEFLLSADEVFLSNSVTGIWPVKTILGTPVNEKENLNMTDKKSMTRSLQDRMDEDLQLKSQRRMPPANTQQKSFLE
ncbi:MAG: aminodeoxychorismate lyase [Cellvibrionaceae bacterium]